VREAQECHTDGLRDRTGHMRKRPLNFIARNSKISLGMENPREPCDSTGESWLSEACHSAGFSVTIRCSQLVKFLMTSNLGVEQKLPSSQSADVCTMFV